MKFPLVKPLSAIILFFLYSLKVFAAQNEAQLVHEVDPGKVQFGIQSSGVFLQNENDSLNGLDFGISAKYSLSPLWALNAGFRQAFDSSDFASMYSSLSVGIDYSPSGILQRAQDSVAVGFSQIARRVEHSQSGWIYGVSINQYFFNGVNNVYPLAGPEVSIKYQMFGRENWHHQIGSSVGYSKNGGQSALVIRLFWDIGYWL